MTSQPLLEAGRTAEPLTWDGAREQVAREALSPGPVGQVGLELEGHLVDLDAPDRRVGWDRLTAVVGELEPTLAGSAVTVEPGGQIELSTTVQPDAAAAIAALQADEAQLRAALAEHRLGVAALGADPCRPAARVNPGPRYAAMEHYFTQTGNGVPGRTMMTSTAALQVNLEAGPSSGWSDRVALAHRLGPVLIAAAACSPALDGRPTGWQSTRQKVWGELDQARCGPLLGSADPAEEWAEYALCAPVMLVRDGERIRAQSRVVPFAAWVRGEVLLADRRPTPADLEYHLTTLFPPVRLRGFLELRYLDAVPRRWWPGLAAVTTLLLDDARAADAARDATEPLGPGRAGDRSFGATRAATDPVDGAWTAAARRGLGDPILAAAARGCLAAAELAAPPALRAVVAAYAELVHSGRCPGDALGTDVRRDGAPAALRAAALEPSGA